MPRLPRSAEGLAESLERTTSVLAILPVFVRAHKSLLTFLSAQLLAAVTVLVGLIATPWLLRWLGDERFGACRVTADWFGYLALFEIGLSGALLPLLAEALGRKDLQLVRNTLVSGVRAYLTASVVMLTGGCALTAAITRLIPVHVANSADLRRGCVIALLGIAFVPLAPFRALVEAQQRGYWINTMLLLQSMLVTVAALAAAWAGWGISGQCLAISLGAIAMRLAVSVEAIREFPGRWIAALRQPPDAEISRRLRSLNWHTLVFSLASRVSLMTDNIIIAGMLGASAAAPFILTQRLAMLGQVGLQGIGNASWAALAELHALGETEVFNRRLIELTTLVTILGVAVLAPMAAYNRSFVIRWVGGERYAGELLTIIASLNAFMLAIFSLWGWCISGTSQIAEMTNAMMAQAVINLVLSVVLTNRLGLIGPVLGTMVAFLAVSTWYLPTLLKRLFGTSLRQLAIAIAAPLELGLPYAAILWWLARTREGRGLFQMASETAAEALLYLAACWLLILKRPERADWSERMRTFTRQIVIN